ncbi:hypothetical protein NLX69_12475 [Rossellomorea sp. BNER]|nr:hypothetical protein [Rossellomorea sp. BNER]
MNIIKMQVVGNITMRLSGSKNAQLLDFMHERKRLGNVRDFKFIHMLIRGERIKKNTNYHFDI